MKTGNILKKLGVAILMASSLYLTGCATIISGTNQSIDVISEPDGADFKLEQLTVSGPILLKEGKTPSTVSLHRKDFYFLLTLTKTGYETAEIPIEVNYNGNPMVLGNLIIGGLIGVMIDAASGAQWSLDPDEVKVNLIQSKL